jgi:hypothetical protein
MAIARPKSEHQSTLALRVENHNLRLALTRISNLIAELQRAVDGAGKPGLDDDELRKLFDDGS